MSARDAGTNIPIWQRSADIATWRMYVDFPPMLGPVMTTRRPSSGDISQSFGMNFREKLFSTTNGCVPSRMPV